MSTLGQRLKMLRKSRSLTLFQMAELMHKDKSCISNFERDERPVPSDFIYSICEEFNVPVEWLFFGIDNGNENCVVESLSVNDNSLILEVFSKAASLSTDELKKLLSYLDYLEYLQTNKKT